MKNSFYDSEDLRLFSLIYSAGSLSAAERQYDVPKSTLSRALSRLEKAAGTALFERVHHGMKPTPLARDLIEFGMQADRALKDADQILRGATAEPTGRLMIAASATSAEFLLSTPLAEFMALYPHVEVHLSVTAEAPDPQVEGIDLVIQASLPRNTSLVARRIISGRTGLYTSVRHRGHDIQKVRELGRILISAKDTPAHLTDVWVLTDGTDELTLDGRPNAYVDDPAIAIDLVAAGCGTTLLPMFFAAPLETAGRISRVLNDWHGLPVELFAVLSPGRRQVAAVRRFLDLLIDHAKDRRMAVESVQSIRHHDAGD